MPKHKKIEREVKKQKLLSILSEVVNCDSHPINMRFLSAKKMLQIYGANKKELEAILKRYRNVID